MRCSTFPIFALGTNPHAVAQLWLFIIAPLIGGGAAGILYREGGLAGAAEALITR
jgi:aquaporin Z